MPFPADRSICRGPPLSKAGKVTRLMNGQSVSAKG